MAFDKRLLEEINWNTDGLVPAIAQDATSGRVLMLAWMNKEALQSTLDKGEAVYWSRSRSKLWHKGETSGHTQRIVQLQLDCDADTLLLQVEQVGGIACHTGRASCMYRQWDEQQGWASIEKPIKSAKDIYG